MPGRVVVRDNFLLSGWKSNQTPYLFKKDGEVSSVHPQVTLQPYAFTFSSEGSAPSLPQASHSSTLFSSS